MTKSRLNFRVEPELLQSLKSQLQKDKSLALEQGLPLPTLSSTVTKLLKRGLRVDPLQLSRQHVPAG